MLVEIIIQVFSVVLGILLALAVNHWQGRRKDRRLLREAFHEIVQEINHNREEMMASLSENQQKQEFLNGVIDTYREARAITYPQWRGSMPNGIPLNFYYPTTAAWETALTTQTVGLIPYSTRVKLAKIHDLHGWLRAATGELVVILHSPVNFREENLFFFLICVGNLLTGIINVQRTLLEMYASSLQQISQIEQIDRKTETHDTFATSVPSEKRGGRSGPRALAEDAPQIRGGSN